MSARVLRVRVVAPLVNGSQAADSGERVLRAATDDDGARNISEQAVASSRFSPAATNFECHASVSPVHL